MDQSIIGNSARATGYGEIEPIDDDKLQSAFRAIAMRTRVEQAYKSLQPNQRTDAALAGLRYGASDHDVALSAFIMKVDPKALEDVRREYAIQQAPLLANNDNRDNYMNSDAELVRRGELQAAARFERQFTRAQSGQEPMLTTNGSGPSLKSPTQISPVHTSLPTDIAAPKHVTPHNPSMNATTVPRIAPDESPQPVNRVEANGPTTRANPLGNPPVSANKKPPEPPPQSAKPSNRTPAKAPLNGTNAPLGENKPDRIANGSAPAFGVVTSAPGSATNEQKALKTQPVSLQSVNVPNMAKGPVSNAPSIAHVTNAPSTAHITNAPSTLQKPVVQHSLGGPAKAPAQGPVAQNGGRIQNMGSLPKSVQNTGIAPGNLGPSLAQKPQQSSPASRTPNKVLAESALTKPKEPSKVQQLAQQFSKRVV